MSDEYDDQPRRRRKKRSRKKSGMPVGQITAIVIGSLLVLLLLGTGGYFVFRKKTPVDAAPLASKDDKDKKPKVNFDPPKKQPVSAVVRWKEVPDVRNILRNLGLAYANYEAERNRGPASAEDLLPYLDKNRKFIEPLLDGAITFIYGASRLHMVAGSSNTILAYETDPDTHGMRVVLMGDGSVQMLDEDTFQKTAKALGR